MIHNLLEYQIEAYAYIYIFNSQSRISLTLIEMMLVLTQ